MILSIEEIEWRTIFTYFFELKDGGYFHLRGYTRFMLTALENIRKEKIFLTGYRKESVQHTGGTHSLDQKWYEHNAESISNEIISQNPDIFTD